MRSGFALLAPALIPSWRFFDTIAASPRIEFARLPSADAPVAMWQEFRPRPRRLTLGTLLGRLFWNPVWNETLFMTSCAERLLDTPTPHSVEEIATRIAATLDPALPGPFFRFRLILVSRDGEALRREVAYVSPLRRIPAA